MTKLGELFFGYGVALSDSLIIILCSNLHTVTLMASIVISDFADWSILRPLTRSLGSHRTASYKGPQNTQKND